MDVDLDFKMPGEAALIKMMELAMAVMEGQPANVRAEMWNMFLQDVKEHRARVAEFKEFWENLRPKKEAK